VSIGTNLGQQHRGAVSLEIGENFLEGEDTCRIDKRHVPETQHERRRAPLNVLQTSLELLRGSEEKWTFNTVDHDAGVPGARDRVEFGCRRPGVRFNTHGVRHPSHEEKGGKDHAHVDRHHEVDEYRQ
jgi:hypothetical protein